MKDEIWKWFGSEYKVHCQRREDYEQMLRWSGCRDGGVYYYPDGYREWDVIIPKRCVNRARAILSKSRRLRQEISNSACIVPQQVTEGTN